MNIVAVNVHVQVLTGECFQFSGAYTYVWHCRGCRVTMLNILKQFTKVVVTFYIPPSNL